MRARIVFQHVFDNCADHLSRIALADIRKLQQTRDGDIVETHAKRMSQLIV